MSFLWTNYATQLRDQTMTHFTMTFMCPAVRKIKNADLSWRFNNCESMHLSGRVNYLHTTDGKRFEVLKLADFLIMSSSISPGMMCWVGYVAQYL